MAKAFVIYIVDRLQNNFQNMSWLDHYNRRPSWVALAAEFEYAVC